MEKAVSSEEDPSVVDQPRTSDSHHVEEHNKKEDEARENASGEDKGRTQVDDRPAFVVADGNHSAREDERVEEITEGTHRIEMSDETTQNQADTERQTKAIPRRAPSHRQRNAMGLAEDTQPSSDSEFDSHPRTDEISKPEIQTIMSQFKDTPANIDSEVPPTPSSLPVFQYPPRTSSLEHATASKARSPSHDPSIASNATTPVSPTDPENASLALSYTQSNNSVAQPPLPEPDPEPDLPFDFHRFLEQLRHRTADPVAKFLRSFLQEFGKKQWLVHEQVKIISDFLTFIAGRMAQCEVWRMVSEAEFDNAKEGMEKLVMNRLYTQTFSPEIPPPEVPKSRRKGAPPLPLSGRRGQHQEDVERDEVLAQKVRIYGWIREEHLDIKPFGEKGRKFLTMAQQEMAKVKSYRAPRDKIICILNCCKVLFGKSVRRVGNLRYHLTIDDQASFEMLSPNNPQTPSSRS